MSIAASASSHACISSIPTCIPSSSSKFSSSLTLSSLQRGSNKRSGCRAMVQQAVQGAPAAYAKEMERLSAKESLLLAFKDAGGFEALVSGKTTEWQKIDVNERITGLERLNPTPRPTTSPFLEGQWNFEWFGSGSPGLFAARFIFEIFPSTLANLSKMDVVIKDGNAKITANMRLLNSIENKVILSTKLSVEGPLRMKEEYVEGVLVTPTIIEERVPEQLKGALGQAANALQQLPTPIWDPVASGLKVPLSGSFQRLFMISYLDEEILVSLTYYHSPESILDKFDACVPL
ncbi:putative plastid-lipid-associated protein 13, chloroplastic isoform B [Glycine soja]|uniref:Putative plastid-lipid-associated protein 13, chloroplastic isoform B n=1 Tax=Glycine soja TaxID=3848 RepID=A0A445LQH3_GLYSO|nr:putative plastid-lipid-associated protein 13, chloroplastic isoform B [Glycine soja]